MLDLIHKLTAYTSKEEIQKLDRCGCFYCQTTFDPKEVVEWTAKRRVAICPRCGVDSVLPDILNDHILREMHDEWFKET